MFTRNEKKNKTKQQLLFFLFVGLCVNSLQTMCGVVLMHSVQFHFAHFILWKVLRLKFIDFYVTAKIYDIQLKCITSLSLLRALGLSNDFEYTSVFRTFVK